MKIIHVAAAVILNDNKQVFIAKRLDNAHQGGLWEFPGGKVESGERAVDALKRELYEELGIETKVADAFVSLEFSYPDKSIFLEVFTVREFDNSPWGKEGQETQWCDIAKLDQLNFPEANDKILEKIYSEFN